MQDTMQRYLTFLLLLFLGFRECAALRIAGIIPYDTSREDETSDPHTNLFYLSKFGMAAEGTLSVFGQVQATGNLVRLNGRMVLVLIPQNLTNNLVSKYTSEACNQIITGVFNDSINVDEAERCPNGSQDIIRKVPCSRDNLASCNQPNSTQIIGNNDFTYVKSASSTQYYYLFMLACSRNFSRDECRWEESENTVLHYDISLVNFDPNSGQKLGPFRYHFPFDLDGVLTIQLIFSIAYFLLLCTHLLLHSGLLNRFCKMSAPRCHMHRLPALFTVSLFFEFLHVLLELIHYSAYAANGFGAIWAKYIGEACNQFSDWLLILVLLLIGKGWMVTTSTVRWKKLTFGIWGAYVFFFTVYFIWTVVQEQVFPLSVSLDDTFQSWPGALYLAYRLILLIYILYEMRQVYLIENRPEKLKLYFTLAFLYGIWFCYLPLIVFVIAFINPLYKFRVAMGFLLSFDLLANIGMVLLFNPKWAKKLFQFDSYLNTVQESRYRGLRNYGSSSLSSTDSTTNII